MQHEIIGVYVHYSVDRKQVLDDVIKHGRHRAGRPAEHPCCQSSVAVDRAMCTQQFLSRVSILLLTRDIDIVILSVRLSVCP